MDEKQKNEIKRDIKNRAIAGGVGGLGGYAAGVSYGIGKTEAEYLRNKKKYIEIKMKKNKNLNRKQLAKHFDEMQIPVQKIIPYAKSKKIKPQKQLYLTKMQIEGARRGVGGLIAGVPAAVTIYSAYDANKDNLKQLMKGVRENGNKLRPNER